MQCWYAVQKTLLMQINTDEQRHYVYLIKMGLLRLVCGLSICLMWRQTTNSFFVLAGRRRKNAMNVSVCRYQKWNEAGLNGMRQECSVTYWRGVGWDGDDMAFSNNKAESVQWSSTDIRFFKPPDSMLIFICRLHIWACAHSCFCLLLCSVMYLLHKANVINLLIKSTPFV